MDFMNSKPFKAAVWVLLIFSIIYIGREVSFIFIPFVVLVRILFLPTLFALILYYLFNPVVNWLEQKKISRPLAIIMIYAALALSAMFMFVTIGVEAYEQFGELIEFFPAYMDRAINALASLENTFLFQYFHADGILSVEDIAESLSDTLFRSGPSLQDSIATAMSILTSTMILFVMLPILLFYLLKDGDKFSAYMKQQIPERYREEASTILTEIDHGLASFIQGQIIVSLSVGVLMYIGFLIIGIPHALILAIFAVLTNFIPYVGPFIATIPAVIVGLFTSPLMAMQVVVVIVVVQQIESLAITPQVMSKKLYIHPLSIIILLLLVGSIAGILGLIIAVPTFVILKIIFSHIFAFVHTKKASS